MKNNFLVKNIFVLILLVIISLIAYSTYTPGAFITGWDTLHPELSFSLNFKNLLFGVWRDNQGLGAVAGHSHIADLPRVVILWLFHFFISLSNLRFSYFMLCLFLGPLGVYFLVKYLFSKKPHASLIAFLSSLFYLLNLSTVQQFYVPFEMFTTQYAFLPWIALFTLQYLATSKKKFLILFSIITLLSTPQAYAAHLWYPFFGIYCLFLALFIYFKKTRQSLLHAFILVILTLTLNSFWLLPNLYFIKTSSAIPAQSKQNRLYSQEYRLRNREQGYLKDVALIRGFYFDWQVYDFSKEKQTPLMPEWTNHLKNPLISAIGYLTFTSSMIGLIFAFRKKEKIFISFLPFFVVPFIFLMNHTFPFSLAFDFLSSFSLSDEALRFVFTKFSIVILFSYVIYFSLFLHFIFSHISKKWIATFGVITTIAFCVYAWPLFQGHLVSDKMKLAIPQEYNAFWNFMNKQPDGVVLSLPLYNFTGWQYYDWGYQGAGFLWFNLKQPLMDRDFDRWSVANEEAFRELHYALYAKNYEAFSKDLQKFNIQYIVWDKHVISPSEKNRNQILYAREITDTLTSLKKMNALQPIGQFNKISVYKINLKKVQAAIKTIQTNITPAYQWTDSDAAYFQWGDYLTDTNSTSTDTVYYPFRNSTDAADRVKPEIVDLASDEKNITLKNFTQKISTYLHVPDYLQTESILLSDIYLEKHSGNEYVILFKPLLPDHLFTPLQFKTEILTNKNLLFFTFNGQSFSVNKSSLPENKLTLIGTGQIYLKLPNYFNGQPQMLEEADSEVNTDNLTEKIDFPVRKTVYDSKKILSLNPNKKVLSYDSKNNAVNFETKNETDGAYIPLDSLNHSLGYILVFNARTVAGLPLRICLKNNYSDICTLYDELSKTKNFKQDYFIIPPIDDSFGYGLSIDNISYGNYETKNQLRDVYVIPFPYTFASQLFYTTAPQTHEYSPKDSEYSYLKISPYLYEFNISESVKKSSLILYQSFHPGWKAYQLKGTDFFSVNFPFIDGKELKNHLLINNWANGWQLDQLSSGQKTIVVIFWPQYLEYLGFLLLILSFIAILLKRSYSQDG